MKQTMLVVDGSQIVLADDVDIPALQERIARQIQLGGGHLMLQAADGSEPGIFFSKALKFHFETLDEFS
ncbi:hypothetical protein [Herbiconiux liukaitaii]|uniref:hypothetical protein n=1 Tax=Herbiconiux liukaitaii TaxID=3342799 RepID=UPI0035B74B79